MRNKTAKIYVIQPAPAVADGILMQPGPAWDGAEKAAIGNYRPEGSAHRPITIARLLHSGEGLYGMFEVADRFVRCVRHGYHSEVWKDSCVECFLQPHGRDGYFNFEFNCGGSWLCNYIRDHRRTEKGFVDCTPLPAQLAQCVKVRSSLPEVIEREIVEPIHWSLNFFLPYALLEHFVGKLSPSHEPAWAGNFYKCAEDTSHPHWGSWAPVDEFNFHLPRCFGELVFAPRKELPRS